MTTSQIQAAKGLGLPCQPDALRKQGQEVAAPLPPPDSNRAGTLRARDLEVPEKPQHGAIFSVHTGAFSSRRCCRGASGPRPGHRCVCSDTGAPTMPGCGADTGQLIKQTRALASRHLQSGMGGGELDYKVQQSKEQEKLWSPMEGKQARGRHHLSQELQQRRESQEQARKVPRGYLLLRKTGHTF